MDLKSRRKKHYHTIPNATMPLAFRLWLLAKKIKFCIPCGKFYNFGCCGVILLQKAKGKQLIAR